MKLTFTRDDQRRNLPTLRELLATSDPDSPHKDQIRPPAPGEPHISRTFIFDGYVYAAVNKFGNDLHVTYGQRQWPCLNLKSQTMRAIGLDHEVEPVAIEVKVFHAKTHRYTNVG
jgi:hypothetical protein